MTRKVFGVSKLVQLEEFERAENIFNDEYAYFSSYSSSWLAHARQYSEAMTARFGLNAASQVVEIASNDGYLLQNFVAAGIPALVGLGGSPGITNLLARVAAGELDACDSVVTVAGIDPGAVSNVIIASIFAPSAFS